MELFETNPQRCEALLDRVTDRAHIIETAWSRTDFGRRHPAPKPESRK